MSYWAKAPCPREQLVLIATTLDDRIPEGHAVRILSEILDGYDWSVWESRYDGRRGQPPIHPKLLAAVWFYGLRRGVRSSRKLEYMVGNNIDFMWLAQGHTPDHSTLNDFRTNFKHELKDLFRYVGHLALVAGFLTLVDVGTDGTRVRANNNRFATWTAAKIEKALQEFVAEMAGRLVESEARDGTEEKEEGNDSVDSVPAELKDRIVRQQKLRAIQEQLREADAARRKDGIDPSKNPAQIPKHDGDSRILPNKEGGYAANYTPLMTSEGKGGYILDCDVIAGPNEHQELVAGLDRIRETFGQDPEHVLADGAFATGPNIAALEARGIEFFSPLPTPAEKDNPAIRADPQQPVPESEWSRLPVNPQMKKLDKACFVYNPEEDVYYCPRGERLPYTETRRETRRNERVAWRVYRCAACAGCPLAERCLSAKNQGGRKINRDVYTPERERLASKMKTAEGQAKYGRRMSIAETPFAFIKQIMGLRQFLLRGLGKVKVEWLWACTAVNLSKLTSDIRRSRALMNVEKALTSVG